MLVAVVVAFQPNEPRKLAYRAALTIRILSVAHIIMTSLLRLLPEATLLNVALTRATRALREGDGVILYTQGPKPQVKV